MAGPSVFAFYVDEDGSVYFKCVRCTTDDYRIPTARVIDDHRWRCSHCRVHGTRWGLARLIVEDADHLARLAEILSVEEVA